MGQWLAASLAGSLAPPHSAPSPDAGPGKPSTVARWHDCKLSRTRLDQVVGPRILRRTTESPHRVASGRSAMVSTRVLTRRIPPSAPPCAVSLPLWGCHTPRPAKSIRINAAPSIHPAPKSRLHRHDRIPSVDLGLGTCPDALVHTGELSMTQLLPALAFLYDRRVDSI